MYARGKKAFGICDRTGFRYPLKDLVPECRNGIPTGLRVGRDVMDKDHPQNFIGRVSTADPQSLYDPRPESNADRGLYSFDPVGHPEVYLSAMAGRVVVAT